MRTADTIPLRKRLLTAQSLSNWDSGSVLSLLSLAAWVVLLVVSIGHTVGVAHAWRCPMFVGGPPPGTTGVPGTTTSAPTTTTRAPGTVPATAPRATTPLPTALPTTFPATTVSTTTTSAPATHAPAATNSTHTRSQGNISHSPSIHISHPPTITRPHSSTPTATPTTHSPTLYSSTRHFPVTPTASLQLSISFGTYTMSRSETSSSSLTASTSDTPTSSLLQSTSSTLTQSPSMSDSHSPVASRSTSLTFSQLSTFTPTKSKTTQIIKILRNWGLLTPTSDGEIVVDGCTFESDAWAAQNSTVTPCNNSQPPAVDETISAQNATTTILRVDVSGLLAAAQGAAAQVSIIGAVFKNNARINVVGVASSSAALSPVNIVISRCQFSGTMTFGVSGITISQRLPVGSAVTIQQNTVDYVFVSDEWSCGSTGAWLFLRSLTLRNLAQIGITQNTVAVNTTNIGNATRAVPTQATSGPVTAVAAGIATSNIDLGITSAVTISQNTIIAGVKSVMRFVPLGTNAQINATWHYPVVTGIYISGTTMYRVANAIVVSNNVANAAIQYSNVTTFPASSPYCTMAYPVAATFMLFGPSSQTYLFDNLAITSNTITGATWSTESTILLYQSMSTANGNCVDSTLVSQTQKVAGPSGVALVAYLANAAMATSGAHSFTGNTFVIRGQQGTAILATTTVLAAFYLGANSALLTVSPGSLTLSLNTYDIRDESSDLFTQKVKNYQAYATALDPFGCTGMCLFTNMASTRQIAVWAQGVGSMLSVGASSSFTMVSETVNVNVLIPQLRGSMVSLYGATISAKGTSAVVAFRACTFSGLAGGTVVVSNFYRNYLKAVKAATPILASSYARIGRFGHIVVTDLSSASSIVADAGGSLEWSAMVVSAASQGGRAAFIAASGNSTFVVSSSSTTAVNNCTIAIKVSSDVYPLIAPFSSATALTLSLSATMAEQTKADAPRPRYAALIDFADSGSAIAVSGSSSFTVLGGTVSVGAAPALEPVVLCVGTRMTEELPNITAQMVAWSEADKLNRWSTGTAIGISVRNGALLSVTASSRFSISGSNITVAGVDHVGGIEIGFGSLIAMDQFSTTSISSTVWNIGGHLFDEALVANNFTNTTAKSRAPWYVISQDDGVCGFSSTASETQTTTFTTSATKRSPTRTAPPTTTDAHTSSQSIPPTSTQTRTATHSPTETRTERITPTTPLNTVTDPITSSRTRAATSTPATTRTKTRVSTSTQSHIPTSTHTSTRSPSPTSTPALIPSRTATPSATPSHSSSMIRSHTSTLSTSNTRSLPRVPTITGQHTATPAPVPSRTRSSTQALSPTATLPSVTVPVTPTKAASASTTHTLSHGELSATPHLTATLSPFVTPISVTTNPTRTLRLVPSRTATNPHTRSNDPTVSRAQTGSKDKTASALVSPSLSGAHTATSPPSKTRGIIPSPSSTPTRTGSSTLTVRSISTTGKRTPSPSRDATKSANSLTSSVVSAAATKTASRSVAPHFSPTLSSFVTPISVTINPTRTLRHTISSRTAHSPTPTSDAFRAHTSTDSVSRTNTHTSTKSPRSPTVTLTRTTSGRSPSHLNQSGAGRNFAQQEEMGSVYDEGSIASRVPFSATEMLTSVAPTWATLEPAALAITDTGADLADDSIVYLFGLINGGAMSMGGNSTLEVERNTILLSGPFLVSFNMWLGVNATSQAARTAENELLLRKPISQFFSTQYFDSSTPTSANRYPDVGPIYDLSPRVKVFNALGDTTMLTGGLNGSKLQPSPTTNQTTAVHRGYTITNFSALSLRDNTVDVFSLYGVGAFWYRRGTVDTTTAASLSALRAQGNSTVAITRNNVRVRGLWGALGVHAEGTGAVASFVDSNFTITSNHFNLYVVHSRYSTPGVLQAVAFPVYATVGNKWVTPTYLGGSRNGQLLITRGSSAIFLGHVSSSYETLERSSESLRGNTIYIAYNLDKLWLGVRDRLSGALAQAVEDAAYQPQGNGIELPCAMYFVSQYSTVSASDLAEFVWIGNAVQISQQRVGYRGATSVPGMSDTSLDGVIQYSYPFVLKSVSAYGFVVDSLSLLEVTHRGSFFVNGSTISITVARAPANRSLATTDSTGFAFANPLNYSMFNGDAFLFLASNQSSGYVYRNSQINIANNNLTLTAVNGTAAVFMSVDSLLWQFRSSSVHLIQGNTVTLPQNASNFGVPFASLGKWQGMSWIEFSSLCVNENQFVNMEVMLIQDMMAWYEGSAFGMRDNAFVNSSTDRLARFTSAKFTVLPGSKWKLPRAKQVTCRNTMNTLPLHLVLQASGGGGRTPNMKNSCDMFPKCTINDGTMTPSISVSTSTTLTQSISASDSVTASIPATDTISLTTSETGSLTGSFSSTLSLSATPTVSGSTSLSFTVSDSVSASVTTSTTMSVSETATVFVTSWCDRIKRPVLEAWYTNSTKGPWQLDLEVIKGEKPEPVALGIETTIDVTDDDIRNGTALWNRTIVLPLPGAPRFIEYRTVEVQIAYRHLLFDYISEDGDRGSSSPAPSRPNPTGFQKFGMVYAKANFQGRGLLNVTLPAIPFYEIDTPEAVVIRMSLRELAYCDDGTVVIGTMNIHKVNTADNTFRSMAGAAVAGAGVLSVLGGAFAATIDLQVMATLGLMKCSPAFLQEIAGVTLRTFSPISIFKQIVSADNPTYVDLRNPQSTMDDGNTFYQTLVGVVTGSAILLLFTIGLQAVFVAISSLLNAGFTRARKWGMVWAPAVSIMVAFALFTGVMFSGVMLLSDSGTVVQAYDTHTGVSYRTIGALCVAAAAIFVVSCALIPICFLSVEYHEVDFTGECITDRSRPLQLDAIIMEILDAGGLDSDDISSGTAEARDLQIRGRRRGGASCCGSFWKSLFHPSGIAMPNKTRRQFYPLVAYRRYHQNPISEAHDGCRNLCSKEPESQGERVKRLSERPRAVHGYLHVWTGFTAIFPLLSPVLMCVGLAVFNSIAPQDTFLAPTDSSSYTQLLAVDFGVRVFNAVAARFELAMAAPSVALAQSILDTADDSGVCFNWFVAVAALHFALGLVVLVWRFWPAHLLNTFSALGLFVNGGIAIVVALAVNDPHNEALKSTVACLMLVQVAVVVVRLVLQAVLWYCDYRLSLNFKDYTPQTNLTTAQDRKQHFSIIPIHDEDESRFEEANSDWCGGRVFPQRTWYHRSMRDRRVFTKRDEALATAKVDLDAAEQMVVFDHAAARSRPSKLPSPGSLHSPLISPREMDQEMMPMSPMSGPRRLGKGRVVNIPTVTATSRSLPPPPLAVRHGTTTDLVDIDVDFDEV